MIADKLKNAKFYYALSLRIETGLKYLEENDLTKVENGKYEIDGENIFIIVQEYMTKPEDKWEAHRKYIDIQYIIEGKEKIGYVNLENLKSTTFYDEGKDIIFLEGKGDFVTLKQDDFAIFTPQDAHMPSIMLDKSEKVKKAVIKVKI